MITEIKSRIRAILNSMGYDIKRISEIDEEANNGAIANSAKKHTPKNIPLMSGLMDYLIQQNAASNLPPPFILQMGANDGISGDPVYSHIVTHRLPAVVIEPNPVAFNQLRNTYAGQINVTPVNVALGHKRGQQYLHSVAADTQAQINKAIKRTALGLSSFSKEHVKSAITNALPQLHVFDDDWDRYIDSQVVEVLTLNDILNQYNVDSVDILQVDIEGFDYLAIESIDFTRINPYIINYESKHLSSEKKKICQDILRAHGYNLFQHGGDTLAFQLHSPKRP